jgi:hypothetical protein
MAQTAQDSLSSVSSQDLVAYSSNWTYALGALNIASSGVSHTGGGAGGGAYWNAVSFNNDQWAQCSIGALSTGSGAMGVGLRMDASSGGNAYFAEAQSTVGALYLEVGYILNGARTVLKLLGMSSWSIGDVILFSVVGNTLSVFQNGSLLYRTTDSTLSAGHAGIIGFGSNTGTINAFSAGDYSLGHQSIITLGVGSIGVTDSYTSPAQTITGAVGTITTAQALGLAGQTATFNEGIILNAVPITGQTAAFAVGVMTKTVTGNVTLALSSQTAQFAQGQLFDNVSYLLDQNLVNVIGQTANFTIGTILAECDYTAPALSATFVEGTLSDNYTFTAPSLTITSVEGTITATQGTNVTPTLGSLVITSSQGALGVNSGPNYTFSSQSASFSVGTITFSATGDQSFSLGPQTITTKMGLLFATGPLTGTGPPLFIPPTLGKPVTTRTFSWADMAMRAWGAEFRAPDHRIYQFSGGNYKDSTDMGTSGIYNPNLGHN